MLLKSLIPNMKKKEKKLQTYESNFFIGQSYFGNYGSQNVLIFQPVYKTFTIPARLPDNGAMGI